MEPKAIVLLSGGLDSAVAGALAKIIWDEDCLALYFDYHQRHQREGNSSLTLTKFFNWPRKVLTIKMPTESALTSSHGNLNRQSIKGLPASFVPGRNLIFLSYAAAIAYDYGIRYIVGGWNCIDYPNYPDCSSGFLTSAENTVNLALGLKGYNSISIWKPLIGMKKKEIIQKGINLGVPFESTWSCYQGGEKPCGLCSSCKFRQKGFDELGIKDPLLKGVK